MKIMVADEQCANGYANFIDVQLLKLAEDHWYLRSIMAAFALECHFGRVLTKPNSQWHNRQRPILQHKPG